MQPDKRRGHLSFLMRYTGGNRGRLILALVTTLLSTLFSFLTPQVIRLTIDSVIDDKPYDLWPSLAALLERTVTRQQLRDNLWIPALAAVIFAVLAALTNFLRRNQINLFAEGTVRTLRNRLFDLTQHLPYEWHVKSQTGDIIQRCTSDIETIRGFLVNQYIELIRVGIMLVLAISMMLSIHLRLALVAIGFIPFIAAYSVFFYPIMAKRFAVADIAEGQVMTAAQENLTGVRVVRAFGRESYEMDKFNALNEHYTGLWVRLGKVMGAYWGLGDFVTGFQNALILVLGVRAVVQGQDLFLGGLVALLTYNGYLIWPVRSLGRILSELSRANVAIARIRDVLEQRPEQDADGAREFEFSGEVVFDNVSFTYGDGPDSKPVLRGVSFTIPAGQTLAILGSTGSGKSTIAHLIPRLYSLGEGQGTISIDGVNINELKMDCLRRQVGIVLQEPFLFSRNLRQNIASSREDLSEEELYRVAEIAAVHRSILSFEHGYETWVGERGVTLSGGQKQRVAIARMLAQNPRIMIFDDSLSAVDTETDASIRAALRNRVGKTTTLLISHRATTLMQADHIIVLDRGRVVEEGTHEQLMALQGVYRRVCDIQSAIDA